MRLTQASIQQQAQISFSGKIKGCPACPGSNHFSGDEQRLSATLFKHGFVVSMHADARRRFDCYMKRLPSTVFFGHPNETMETFLGFEGSACPRSAVCVAAFTENARTRLRQERACARKGLRHNRPAETVVGTVWAQVILSL